MSSTTGDRARQAFTDMRVVTIEVDAAVQALEVGTAGYPTQTPGASPLEARPLEECPHPECDRWKPCEVHDPAAGVELTGPEALAGQGDVARQDLERLVEHVRQVAHHARAAAAITHRWAWSSPTESMVADALAAIDGDIWCQHCVRFGEHNPREEDRTLCSWCRQFERDWKRRPPREIWEARNARGGRLDVSTIERILKQVKRTESLDRSQAKAERLREREAERRARLDNA